MRHALAILVAATAAACLIPTLAAGANCTTGPPTPPNAVPPVGGCNNTAGGGACNFTCATNYNGSWSFTCLNTTGTWQAQNGSTCTLIGSCSGNPTAVPPPNSVWNCQPSTPSNYWCQASCVAGYTATPFRPFAWCSNWQWGAVNGSNNCQLTPCNGKPTIAVPGGGSWPDSCNNSPGNNTTCAATCNSGLTGSIQTSCASGVWQALSGNPCVNCTVSLAPSTSAPISLCTGNAALTTSFWLTATYVQGPIALTASVAGGSCNPIAPLTGPQSGKAITVSCSSSMPGGFADGAAVQLIAAYTGSSGCANGTATASTVVALRPPPAVNVTANDVIALGCSSTSISSVRATFRYSAAAGPDSGTLQLAAAASASLPALCTVTPSNLRRLQGEVTVVCRGDFRAAGSVVVSLTVSAAQPGCSKPATSTASTQVQLVCCKTDVRAAGVFPDSVQLGCSTCSARRGGVLTSVSTPYQQFCSASGAGCSAASSGVTGQLLLNAFTTGAACTPAGSGTSAVGTVSVTCNEADNALFFSATTGRWNLATYSYLIRCENQMRSCASFSSPAFNNPAQNVTTTLDGANIVTSWQFPLQSSCRCSTAYWAVAATGTFVC